MCVKGRDLLERIADAKDELKLAKVEEQKAWDAWQAEASAKLSETLSEKASEARSEVKQLEQLIADAKVEFATLHAAYLEAVKGIV
jgi:phosphoribosylaminoimidazole-succinocarboxamide synthase